MRRGRRGEIGLDIVENMAAEIGGRGADLDGSAPWIWEEAERLVNCLVATLSSII